MTADGPGSADGSGLDRLRPRAVPQSGGRHGGHGVGVAGARASSPAQSTQPAASPGAPASRDAEGKQALFSAEEQQAAFGGITMTCGECGQRSVLSGRRALRSLVPSVHLPRPRSSYRSWMRCPACGRRTWVELRMGG